MKSSKKIFLLIYPVIFLAAALFIISCENIFSPSIDNTNSSTIITDQTTIDGLYTNFKYAYTFKDSSVYGNLLAEDFIFTYRDYSSGFDVSWDRQTEMKTTSGLFQNSQKLEVVWNNIIFQEGDSLTQNVKRSFNLTLTFNPQDIIRLAGFADMKIVRASTGDKWKINKWRDETF